MKFKNDKQIIRIFLKMILFSSICFLLKWISLSYVHMIVHMIHIYVYIYFILSKERKFLDKGDNFQISNWTRTYPAQKGLIAIQNKSNKPFQIDSQRTNRLINYFWRSWAWSLFIRGLSSWIRIRTAVPFLLKLKKTLAPLQFATLRIELKGRCAENESSSWRGLR